MTSQRRMFGHPGSRRAALAAGFASLLFTAAACGSQIAGSGSAPSVLTTPASSPPFVTTPSSAKVSVEATSSASSASGSSTSAEPSEPAATITQQKHIDACTLLTNQEANALADMTLQAGVGGAPENGVNTVCQYTRDPNRSGVGQVSIVIGDSAKDLLETDKNTLGHPFATVPGIGDEALQEDNAIFVRKGDTWVSVALALTNDPATNVKPLQQAAKIVVGRL